ncbi:MAG TPA: GNAT family N-acetyltransferase [Methyloceanibacter sp.]|nr:GNAT family N-acetyltransferase [Methyloceanibacter sp.]
MKPLATLRGSNTLLAPLLPGDVSADYVSWLNDAETTRYTEARHRSHDEESTRQYVAEASASKSAALWSVKVGAEHVGNIRLSNIDPIHRRAAVAILIGSGAQRGVGVGTEAIALVTRFAFDELAIEKLVAGIYETNIACRRAFEKARYHLDAVLTRHVISEGKRIDVLQLARFSDHECDAR